MVTLIILIVLVFGSSIDKHGDRETRESWNFRRIDDRMIVVFTEEKQSGNSLPGQWELVIENCNSRLGSVDHLSRDVEPANNLLLRFRSWFTVLRPEGDSIIAQLPTKRFLIIYFVKVKLIILRFHKTTAAYFTISCVLFVKAFYKIMIYNVL